MEQEGHLNDRLLLLFSLLLRILDTPPNIVLLVVLLDEDTGDLCSSLQPPSGSKLG